MKCLIDPTVTADEEITLAKRAGDEMLVEACHFYRQREDILDYSPDFLSRYPAMHEAYQLFRNCRQVGDYKWLIEALMMTDASDEEIAAEFGPLYGAETIKRYRYVYFDVEEVKKKDARVFCTLLANSLEQTHHSTPCDFSWKLLAYYQGIDAFREFIKFQCGGTLPDPILSWMRDSSHCRKIYGEFHLTASLKQLYKQEALGILEHADRHWNNAVSNKLNQLGNVDDLVLQTGEGIITMCQEALLDPELEQNSREAKTFYEAGVSPKFQPDADLHGRVIGPISES